MIDYIDYKGFSLTDADFNLLRDEDGHVKTQKLFVEFTEKGEVPLFTLRDSVYQGYPSAYQIYMNSIDEYDAAIKLVGSMAHWRKLCKLGWFLKKIHTKDTSGLIQWREDMALRDMSRAKEIIQESLFAQKCTKEGELYSVTDSNAAKKLLDLAKSPANVGNVTKAETTRKKKVKVERTPEEAKILDLHKRLKNK